MYLLDTLYYLYKPVKRADLISVCSNVARDHKTSKVKIMLDMICSSLFLGAMWTEYGDLNFYERTWSNRKTFITTFYNFKLYKKLNNLQSRNMFRDKTLFLQAFSDYVRRAWINIDECPDEEIEKFLRQYRNIVAKASCGDSGKEVEVIALSPDDDAKEVTGRLRQQRYNLLEERILNCEEIRMMNPSSLNTLRIVTVRNEKKTEILFAGIRIGGENAKIDNISQGGRVARIDIETGKIDSPFYFKASSHSAGGSDQLNAIGFQIPMWAQVIETVKKAALVVPDVRIIAWDVAVTPYGVELVEGNESFGSVVMQLYYQSSEVGLKPRLLEMIDADVLKMHK